MLALALDNPATYRRMLAIYGGDMSEAFSLAVQKILRRYFAQNAFPAPSDPALAHFSKSLWLLVLQRGLPPHLTGPDQGTAADLPEPEVAALVSGLLTNFPFTDARAALSVPARDFIRAVFQPEFKKCRLSYKEPAAGATTCERQDYTHTRTRISGTHCVDCPYWVQVNPEKNEKLLIKEWNPAAVAELTTHLAVFLPEDFRTLRHLLHLHARFGKR
jgi:hypothetical protein